MHLLSIILTKYANLLAEIDMLDQSSQKFDCYTVFNKN